MAMRYLVKKDPFQLRIISLNILISNMFSESRGVIARYFGLYCLRLSPDSVEGFRHGNAPMIGMATSGLCFMNSGENHGNHYYLA